jgi:hypothetical protein
MSENMEEHHQNDEYSPDFDFRHYLYDTIILLGGRKEIADLLKKSQDYKVSSGDIDNLRRYNCGLIDEVKRRLMSINTMTIQKSL